ncbi:hypothetical protein PISMIDRAFT_686611 [Pisolithus microcarpus 441]|uniref:Uncharacterized protein n=1 Tax=Pisolithus microcarpus 441 TaxID=765257 RepID=A0A0C9YHN4_9AGAM|nr:hypothetical protein PISMIDRAFT_686611 [Pisolithus microcarpus 441]
MSARSRRLVLTGTWRRSSNPLPSQNLRTQSESLSKSTLHANADDYSSGINEACLARR